MPKNSESAAAGSNRVFIKGPLATPFAARHSAPTTSRAVLTDAAACFLATALGSLTPQALTFLEPAPVRHVVASDDVEGGKFVDRILIGGLQPISFELSKAPPPVFTTIALPPSAADAQEDARPAVQKVAIATPALARPLAKRSEKIAETKPASAAPPAATETLASADSRQQEAPAEAGVLAALTPSSLSSKLAPLGRKVWGGAKSVGNALNAGLGWFGN
jgi:hypothetical protein